MNPQRAFLSLFAVAFASPAFALDCTNRDQDVCDAVNALVPMVNAEAGATVLVQSSPAARFRPTNVYTQLLAVRNAAVASGCEIDGYTGGIYDAAAPNEDWSGELEYLAGGSTFDAGGVCDLSPNEWSGTASDGVDTLLLGDDVGLHNAAGKIVADIDDDGSFKAGYWLRQVGNRGVYVALTGTCGIEDGDAGDALEGWWGSALGDFGTPPVTNLAPAGTASQSSTGFGGAPGRANDGNTNGVYNNASVSHTNNGVEEWWQVDLGSVKSITDVVVWNRTDCCTTRLNNFRVHVSDVPFASNDVATTIADSNVTSIFFPGNAATTNTFTFNRTGRYVRVQQTGANTNLGNDYLHLAEVQVLGY